MMNINKMPQIALENLKIDLECALIRAEVDEDIKRYIRIHGKLKEVNAELKRRTEEKVN